MAGVLSHIERAPGLFEATVPFDQLAITSEDIVRVLGYSEQQVPEYFHEHVKTILAEAPKRCTIRAGYKILSVHSVEHRRNDIAVDDIVFHVDKIIAAQFRKAESAALFVCTIGPGMETWAKECSHSGDMVMSYFIDAAASAIAEQTAEAFHNNLEQRMNERGQHVTNRYSPGYCGWATAEQQVLFSFFPKSFCGITLTESSLMVPRKSVSGIIGIGAHVKRMDYACDHCTLPGCTYRTHRRTNMNSSLSTAV